MVMPLYNNHKSHHYHCIIFLHSGRIVLGTLLKMKWPPVGKKYTILVYGVNISLPFCCCCSCQNDKVTCKCFKMIDCQFQKWSVGLLCEVFLFFNECYRFYRCLNCHLLSHISDAPLVLFDSSDCSILISFVNVCLWKVVKLANVKSLFRLASSCHSGHFQASHRRQADQCQRAAVFRGWLLAKCVRGEHQRTGAGGGGEEERGEHGLLWDARGEGTWSGLGGWEERFYESQGLFLPKSTHWFEVLLFYSTMYHPKTSKSFQHLLWHFCNRSFWNVAFCASCNPSRSDSCAFTPKGAHADSKNAKKKNNKKTNKNKSSVSRANKKKPGMPNVANDLSQKLYATMEKHKEVSKPSNLPPYSVYFHRQMQW